MISKCIVGSMALLTLTKAGRCPFGYGGGDAPKPVKLNLLQTGDFDDLNNMGDDFSNSTDNDTTTDGMGGNRTAGNRTAGGGGGTAGGGPDATTDDDDDTTTRFQYPSDVLTCPAGKIQVQSAGTFDVDMYEHMFRKMSMHMETHSPSDQTSMAACLVRLAGHDFMDFRLTNQGKSSIGGSDGCVNFNDPDNKGLAQCLIRFNIQSLYAEYCDKMSLADFMVVSAEMVMGRLASDYDPTTPFKEGTLAQRFRAQLMVGRQTVAKCPNAVGLMPNPEEGCDALKEIFVDNIFKTKFHRWKAWRAVTAISGAHTLGQANLHNSGYNGHWSSPEDQGKFNNGYYKSMLIRGWGPERNVSNNPNKNQWKRIDNIPCNQDFHEMMLNTDMCLAYQFNKLHADCMKKENRNVGKCNKFQRKGRFLNAKTDSCCAWTHSHIVTHTRFGPVVPAGQNDVCGEHYINGDFRGVCCKNEDADSVGDCDAMNWPKGIAFDHVLKFAGHENEFYKAFLEAWKVAVENGFPKPLQVLGK